LRRRAACAVLAPLLDEDALMVALQLQHDHLRGDGVADLIAYIDNVANRNQFDQATRKRLYQTFFEALRQPESSLPLDPWPAMQVSAAPMRLVAPGPIAPGATSPEQRPPTPEVQTPAVVAVATTSPATGSPEPSPPPAQQVFAALMRAALADVRQLHGSAVDDVCSGALAMLPRQRLAATLRQQLLAAWQQAESSPWRVDATESGLSEAVNLFYVALCESLGPVDADHVLTRAVRTAELAPGSGRGRTRTASHRRQPGQQVARRQLLVRIAFALHSLQHRPCGLGATDFKARAGHLELDGRLAVRVAIRRQLG
jgi:hypothetical protein